MRNNYATLTLTLDDKFLHTILTSSVLFLKKVTMLGIIPNPFFKVFNCKQNSWLQGTRFCGTTTGKFSVIFNSNNHKINHNSVLKRISTIIQFETIFVD